jgi:hypothetical protein
MLNQKQQNKAMTLFNKKTTDARKIAKEIGISRFDVMRFLEEVGLKKYSEGSYS